jgi:predicted nucleic acid-binding protein
MNILNQNMVNKLFLDTNILVDYTLERIGELEEIGKIFDLAEENKIQLFISESVLATTIYFLEKNKSKTLTIIREISKVLNFLTFKKEILSYSLEQFDDVEDGLLYFIALKAGMQYFITRNTKDFQSSSPSLPVFTPSQYLKEIYLNDIP